MPEYCTLSPVIASAEELIEWALDRFGSRLAFVTSFQAEGMVLLDMAARLSTNIRVVTLDTGRLPEETFEMIEIVRSRYGVSVEIASPEASEIGAMVSRYGPNLFYSSIAYRRLCCHIRKVRPLERKLAAVDAWVSGLRRGQSGTRAEVEPVSYVDGKAKISPLAEWSAMDVTAYIAEHRVPQHPLYFKGYTSIGCEPCSRAITAGEDERAGRWWWEHGEAKECGLHFATDDHVQSTVDVLLRDILPEKARVCSL